MDCVPESSQTWSAFALWYNGSGCGHDGKQNKKESKNPTHNVHLPARGSHFTISCSWYPHRTPRGTLGGRPFLNLPPPGLALAPEATQMLQ